MQNYNEDKILINYLDTYQKPTLMITDDSKAVEALDLFFIVRMRALACKFYCHVMFSVMMQ